MEEKILQKSRTWLQDLAQGNIGQGLETRALEMRTVEGLRVNQVHQGFIRCDFIIQSPACDVDGNWHVGAIATLMDAVAAATVYTIVHRFIASVDFSISYYATAKIQEHVEIDGQVITNKGKLTHVMVEIRRKGSGELIALGKQWMVSSNLDSSQSSKL